jgi:hypothetical protein
MLQGDPDHPDEPLFKTIISNNLDDSVKFSIIRQINKLYDELFLRLFLHSLFVG